MKIEIYTNDKSLAPYLLGKPSISPGDCIEISPGAKLTYEGVEIRKGVGFPDALNFTLEITNELAKGLAYAIVID
ncbi:MAG: hypothetical protein L0209_09450, partial [candidate division Zixibacteria bacterium]|nr:hypothetical protein [candidate division Zixibacteria bacterium]